MLRRPGSHIELPSRKDLRMHLSFNDRELEMYRAAKEKALASINDALSGPGGYKNAVQKITRLRLICNHGLWQSKDGHAPNLSLEEDEPRTELWSTIAAHKALNQFPSLGLSMTCYECNSIVDIDVKDGEYQLLEPTSSTQVYLTKCLQLWCTPCYSSRETLSKSLSFCNCDTDCTIATVQLDAVGCSPSPLAVTENDQHEQQNYPTKIRALLDDVQKLASSTKRYAFSLVTIKVS